MRRSDEPRHRTDSARHKEYRRSRACRPRTAVHAANVRFQDAFMDTKRGRLAGACGGSSSPILAEAKKRCLPWFIETGVPRHGIRGGRRAVVGSAWPRPLREGRMPNSRIAHGRQLAFAGRSAVWRVSAAGVHPRRDVSQACSVSLFISRRLLARSEDKDVARFAARKLNSVRWSIREPRARTDKHSASHVL